MILPARRPTTPETLESLRATLQTLEQTNDPTQESFHELKRILLARIADLEVAQALEAQAIEATAAPVETAPEPADLVPPPTAVDENKPGQPTSGANLEKLD